MKPNIQLIPRRPTHGRVVWQYVYVSCEFAHWTAIAYTHRHSLTLALTMRLFQSFYFLIYFFVSSLLHTRFDTLIFFGFTSFLPISASAPSSSSFFKLLAGWLRLTQSNSSTGMFNPQHTHTHTPMALTIFLLYSLFDKQRNYFDEKFFIGRWCRRYRRRRCRCRCRVFCCFYSKSLPFKFISILFHLFGFHAQTAAAAAANNNTKPAHTHTASLCSPLCCARNLSIEIVNFYSVRHTQDDRFPQQKPRNSWTSRPTILLILHCGRGRLDSVGSDAKFMKK